MSEHGAKAHSVVMMKRTTHVLLAFLALGNLMAAGASLQPTDPAKAPPANTSDTFHPSEKYTKALGQQSEGPVHEEQSIGTNALSWSQAWTNWMRHTNALWWTNVIHSRKGRVNPLNVPTNAAPAFPPNLAPAKCLGDSAEVAAGHPHSKTKP